MDIHNPHDSFVRSWLSRPDQLEAFLRSYLPADVVSLFDPSTLVIHDGTYIDEEHQKHFSDIAATVDIRRSKAHVYILVEHKSYNDPWALLQILRYMVQTWTRDSKESGSRTLVPIIPILFYHGEAKTIRTSFPELFPPDGAPALKAYQPRFLCDVFNLTTLSDDQIKGPPEQEAALWALKYARTQTEIALRALDRLVQTVGEALLRHPSFKDIELYLMASSEMSPEQIIDKINASITNLYLKEDIMSTAEMLISRGEARGEARGKQEEKPEIARLPPYVD